MRARHAVWVAGLMLTCAAACKKDGGGGTSKGTDPEQPAQPDPGPQPPAPPTPPGPDMPQIPGGPAALTVAGQINLSTGTTMPDTVAAFPVVNGVFEASALGDVTSAQVTSTGQVNLQIDDAAALTGFDLDAPLPDVVVATYDTAAGDRFEVGKTFKFITAKTAATALDGVMNLPAPKEGSSIDFGNIDLNQGDEAASSKTLDPAGFEVPVAVLDELATTDKALKTIKNTYMNTDDAKGVSLKVSTSFTWGANMKDALGLTAGTYMGVDKLNYFGFGIGFSGKHPDLTPEALCDGWKSGAKTPPKTLKLIPPAIICASDRGVDPDTEGKHCTVQDTGAGTESYFGFDALDNLDTKAVAESNGVKSCYSDDNQPSGYRMHLFGMKLDSNPNTPNPLNFQWAGGYGFVGDVPGGYWDLKLDDVLIGRFDIASSYPFREVGGHVMPTVYLPAVRLATVAGDGGAPKLTAVEVVFFRATGFAGNGDLTFEQVKDYTAMKRVLKDAKVSVTMRDMGNTLNAGQWAYASAKLPDGDAALSFPVTGFDVPDEALPNHDWYLCDVDVGNVDANDCPSGTFHDDHKVADGGIAVDYTMYGNQYRFEVRFPPQ